MKARSFAIILVSILISAGNAWASPVIGNMSHFKMDRHDDDRSSDRRHGNDWRSDRGRDDDNHDNDRRSTKRHNEMRDEFDYDEIILPPDNNGDSKVVYEKVELFRKKTWFTDSFYIDTAGTYQAILTDFEFPNPLKYSGLNITTATDSLGKLFGPGSFTFDAEPGKYYVNFFAMAGNGKGYRMPWERDMDMDDYGYRKHGYYGNKLGQYGIEISMVSAVPVPAALWLFGSGLLGLIGMARTKSVPKTTFLNSQ